MAEDRDPFEQTRMTLGEHLGELRSRLFKGVITVAIAFFVAFYFKDEIAQIVSIPHTRAMGMLETHLIGEAEDLLEEHNVDLEPEDERFWKRSKYFETDDPTDERLRGWDTRLHAIGAGEVFLYKLKICLYFALVAGGPVLLWQMWRFIAAGLYRKEQKAILRYFPVSVVMFAVGILFGFFVIVPYGMYFLNKDADVTLALPTITTKNFLTFLTGLCLAFGVIFQLPLIMTFLGGADIVQPRTMSKYRGHCIVGAFVVAAMLTPPDPITQLMMGIPLIILYEIGVWGARIAAGRRKPTGLALDGGGDGG